MKQENKFKPGDIVVMKRGFSVHSDKPNYAGSGWCDPEHPDFRGLVFEITDIDYNNHWATLCHLDCLNWEGSRVRWAVVIEGALEFEKSQLREKKLELILT